MKRIYLPLIIAAIFSLFISCEKENTDDDKSAGLSYQVGDSSNLLIKRGGKILFDWQSVDVIDFTETVGFNFGFFDFAREVSATTRLTFVVTEDGPALGLPSGETAPLAFDKNNAGWVSVGIDLPRGVEARGMRLNFNCAADDEFWGFGEQYSFIDFRNMILPIWVNEQGVGRREKPARPPQGRLTDSYFPMPYFIDPAAGKGFLLENSEFSQFELCTENSQWTAEVWNGKAASVLFLGGPQPADVVSQLTARLGRAKSIPPDWSISGVWISAQGGTEAVREYIDKAIAADIPVSVVWSQDWVGARSFDGGGSLGVMYHWSHAEEYYAGLAEYIAELGDQGVRFIGYFNPFVLPELDHWEEMAANGWLVETSTGAPYTGPIITFSGGQIDVFNPGAVQYFQHYARLAIDMGQRGWMADFAEWLPYDGVVEGGTGAELHNLYPTEWHRINREVLEEAYGDDFIMLTRSGYTGEHEVAQVVWAGDQEATFDDGDGISTVITAALNIGLSGVPFYTHDIAGFSGGPSDKQLYLRWTELGAFTPIMRTHEGLRRLDNHNWDSDAETIEFFARFSQIHQALFPYFKEVAIEAQSTGLPMIRHTVLVDPKWETARKAHWQWMIGSDLLFAPVVERDAEDIMVHFPAGNWEHLLTGEKYPGRRSVRIAAPIGTPAVFIRSGKMPEMVEAARTIYNR